MQDCAPAGPLNGSNQLQYGNGGAEVVELRPYQHEFIGNISNAMRVGHRRVLGVMPTGSGKGTVIAYMVAKAAVSGHRILILAHRSEIIGDLSERIHGFGVNHGVIASGYREDLRHNVHVGSVQTVVRRLGRLPDYTMIIQDEAHHLVAGNMWGKIISRWPNAYLIGKTATPERLSGEGLGEGHGGFFQHMVTGPSAAWLTEQGYLCPARIYAPPGLDLSGIRRFDTRKGHDEAEQRLRQGQTMGDAVTHYRRTIEPEHNGTAISFCVSVAHAEAVADAFRQQGIPAAMLDGATDRGVRKRMIADLGAGVLKVLTSCDIISEGTDIPSVSGAILLRPTDSLGLHLQQVGRVLRTASGKRVAIINDHVGNSHRHGLPTDERDWSLAGRPTRKRDKQAELPVKVCPQCFCTVASVVSDCPECGHHWEPPRRELVTVSGSLQELTAEQHALNQRRQVAKARTREELEALRLERGYSRGWTDHILRARAKHGR
jgi:DNA repair protein RadD